MAQYDQRLYAILRLKWYYFVFNSRAELMGWSSSTSIDDRMPLWAMEEAEIITDTYTSLIGFVQVGLNVGSLDPMDLPPRSGYSHLPFHRQSSEPALVLPALVQCFADSLSRFGVLELTGIQVTAIGLSSSTRFYADHLVSTLNWFRVASVTRAEAAIAFDHELLGDQIPPGTVASLQNKNYGPIEFGAAVTVPEWCMIKVTHDAPWYPVFQQSALGVAVTIREWTPSAAGWTLAIVLDAARAINPDASDFALRITRV